LDCEKYASEILSEIESSGVVFMGFDCEWVGKNKTGMIYFLIIGYLDSNDLNSMGQTSNNLAGVVNNMILEKCNFK